MTFVYYAYYVKNNYKNASVDCMIAMYSCVVLRQWELDNIIIVKHDAQVTSEAV